MKYKSFFKRSAGGLLVAFGGAILGSCGSISSIAYSKKMLMEPKQEKYVERIAIDQLAPSDAIIPVLHKLEGFRSKSYFCAGNTLTIGNGTTFQGADVHNDEKGLIYAHAHCPIETFFEDEGVKFLQDKFSKDHGIITLPNQEDQEKVVKWTKKEASLSPQQAGALTRYYLETVAVRDLQKHVKVPMAPYEYDGLISFTYNVGCGANKGLLISDTLFRLNKEDYEGASEGMMHFAKAGGQVLPGLIKRRMVEMSIWMQKSFDYTSNDLLSKQWEVQEPKKWEEYADARFEILKKRPDLCAEALSYYNLYQQLSQKAV